MAKLTDCYFCNGKPGHTHCPTCQGAGQVDERTNHTGALALIEKFYDVIRSVPATVEQPAKAA